MYRKRKKRKILILSLIGIVFLMSAGYAAFQTNLKIKGTTKITSLWDIRITNVTSGTATGSAKNAVAPTWDKLTANMEANLYEKGDAMEYDVTITNNGTVDAVLSDVIGTPSNSEAVLISFTGYTKGEKLYKKGHTGNTKVVHVRIEYNPEYNGGETSGEAKVEFNYTQAEGGDIKPAENTHLLTYNYSENGGKTSTAINSYIEKNSAIDLTQSATKPGYEFVGWNTNKNAQTALSTLSMGDNDITLYAIFKKTYTITYEKGENVQSISKQSDTCTVYNKQTTCNVTLPTITPNAGYTADTWYNGTQAVGRAGESYTVSASVTLATKETVNKYTITFKDNEETIGTKEVTYGEKYGELPTPTKEGYTFEGWFDQDTKITSDSNVTITSNQTLTAKWTINSYDLIYDYQHDSYTYEGSDTFDTGYKIDWSKDFKIEAKFKVAATGKRYAVFTNYNSGTETLAVELNTANKLRVYMGTGSAYSDLLSSQAVPVNEEIIATYTWNAKTKTYTLKATGTTTDISMTKEVSNISGTASRNIFLGRDTRTTTFSPITISSFKIQTEYNYNDTISPLPTVEKVGYTINGWYESASGGNKITSVTIPAQNKIVYLHKIANELTFANQTVNNTFNTSSQTINITPATNGTGSYTYTEKSEKNSSGANTNYLSISGTTITVAANTPAGTYTYVITAKDKNSGVTKDATYTITIGKKKGTLNVSETSKTLEYGTAGTVTYTYDGDGAVTCESSDSTKVTCQVDTTNKKITLTPVSVTSSNVTVTIKAAAGNNYSAADNKTISVKVDDTTNPSVSDIGGGTTLKATSQNLTLKATDGVGITAYYFGTTEPTSASAITTTTAADLTSIQGSGLTKNVTQEGTYWFAVKDAAGNFSKKSIVIRKYQVQNVLETIAASSNTTYTNANYAALNDTKTYYVKDGTTLTLTSSYTKPTGGNTFKGYTTSAPSATAQTPSTTNPKVATNNTTVYYMWFTRLTYTVTVSKPTNGSIKAETVTKTGNSVTASYAAASLTVKYGDTVKATATPSDGYSLSSWSGGYVSGSTNPVTGAIVTAAKTITATFTEKSYTMTYNDNLFTGTSGTKSGVTTSVDTTKSELSLDGTWNTTSISLWNYERRTLEANEQYKVTLTYVEGSYTTTVNPVFVLDLTNNGSHFSDRGTAPRSYVTLTLPKSGTSSVTITVDSSRATANGLNFWLWHSTANATTFTDYKARVEITKVHSKSVTYNSEYGQLDTPTKTGYTFNGWYTSLTGGTKVESTTKVTNTNNHTLYARWTANTPTLTVNANGGSIPATTGWTVASGNETATKTVTVANEYSTLPTPTREGYTFKGWYTASTGGSQVTSSTYVTNVSNHTLYARWADETNPSVSDIGGGTTLKATSQNLTLKATDGVGITAYYFGTTEPTSASAITTTTAADLTSIQGSGLTKNVTQEGTYWFAVKDAAGNFSKKSIVIRKYQVQNVLETIAASSNTTYTNANYAALNDTKTYYVKDGTTLTLTSSYTKPTGGNTFKGYTTSAPSATAQTPSTTNPKVATNNTTVYYMWFTRLTYTVTVSKPTNGSIKAETVTKTGNSVTASYAAASLTVKYGDTVKATATPNTNCEFESWSGGYVSGSTNPVTGAIVTSAKTITATFKVLPIIKAWSSGASSDFHNSTYRTNITSVIFEDNINIPSGATSWDVSAVANSGAVMAWVTVDPEDSTKYVLHIGGEGGVIANKNSSYIFYDFTNTKSINFNNNYDTNSVTSMSYMFYSCKNLTSLDLGDKFDTSSVTIMDNMFSRCSSLTSLDLGDKFDTSSVGNMSSMFNGCKALISLDLGDKFDTSSVRNMSSMFSGCNALINLDLGDKFDTSRVTNMGYMFESCRSLTTLDLGDKFDTSSVTNMEYMFLNSGDLASLDLGDKFDTSSVTTMANMFDGCISLTSLDLGDKFDTSSVTKMQYMFSGCSILTSLDLGDKFDTSSVGNMSSMFSGCNALTSLDLGDKFDTSSVTSMEHMFSGCSSLTSLDLGDKFDTSNVTYMQSMFYNCRNLTNLDLGDKFDTSRVTTMSYMFNGCQTLTSLDLGDKFDTSSVTNMQYMFSGCSILTSLDLGDKFDTSSVTNMDSMFYGCSGLTNLDLGDKFDTSSVTNMQYMFSSCTNIKTIFAPTTFVTTNVSSSNNMFTYDTKLVGGNGTAVATKQVYNKTYAKIDKPGQEGYFTRSFATPKFTEAEGANNSVDVTITFPAGCSTDLTCKYKKDDGSYVTVTSSSVVVNFTEAGTLSATVTDGVTTKSASYTVLGKTSMDIVANAGESCEGELVEDANEPGRYIYRGKNPCNYINIKENGTNVKYRIYSIEADGTVKVIRDEAVTSMNFDANDATRRKGGYCTSNYCNAWAAMDNFVNGSNSGAVAGLNGNSGDSSIKEYIESTYKNTLDDYSKIVSKTWNISGTTYNRDTLENAIADEKKSTWNGKIALLTASEYVRANTNTSSCGTLANLYSNNSACKSTNYLVKSSSWWLLSPYSSARYSVLRVYSDSYMDSYRAINSIGVRPSFYLCSGLVYSGEGTSTNPYEIAGGKCAKYTGSIYRAGKNEGNVYNWKNGMSISSSAIYNITQDGVYGHGPTGDYTTLEECEAAHISQYGGNSSLQCRPFERDTLIPVVTGPYYYSSNSNTIYLKYDIEDDIIMSSYACFVMGGLDYCLKGNDTSFYEANKTIIRTYQSFNNLSEVSNPLPSNPGCNYSNSYSYCYGGNLYEISSSPEAAVIYTDSNKLCAVGPTGTYCQGF